MIGNISYINNKVKRNPKSPIQDLRIIEVINQEFWKEWRKMINECPKPSIQVDNLGRFDANYGKLKSYIRNLINQIRQIRRSDLYKEKDLAEVLRHDKLIIKLRVALKQLNNLKLTFHEYSKKYKEKARLRLAAQEGNNRGLEELLSD